MRQGLHVCMFCRFVPYCHTANIGRMLRVVGLETNPLNPQTCRAQASRQRAGYAGLRHIEGQSPLEPHRSASKEDLPRAYEWWCAAWELLHPARARAGVAEGSQGVRRPPARARVAHVRREEPGDLVRPPARASRSFTKPCVWWRAPPDLSPRLSSRAVPSEGWNIRSRPATRAPCRELMSMRAWGW